jgi:hypothetical protein
VGTYPDLYAGLGGPARNADLYGGADAALPAWGVPKKQRVLPADSSSSFACAVCGDNVVGMSRVEHERGTVHRFHLYEMQQPEKVGDGPSDGLNRLARLRKAEVLVAEEEAKQKHLRVQRVSVGYRMLQKQGWKEGEGIGLRPSQGPVQEPIRTRLVSGRPGIERHVAQPARIHHVPIPARTRRKGAAASGDAGSGSGAGSSGGGGAGLTKDERRQREERDARLHAVFKQELSGMELHAGAGHPVRILSLRGVRRGRAEGNTGPLWRRAQGK